MLEVFISIAVSLASVTAIYMSWWQRGLALLSLFGWLLALISILLWSRALGPEFGVSYAIMVFVCLVWGYIAWDKDTSKTTDETVVRPYRAPSFPELSALLKHGGLFLVSVPASGVVALMLSVALVIWLPWALLTQVAVAVFLYPVIWGAMAAWICAQQSVLKPALLTVVFTLLSGLILLV